MTNKSRNARLSPVIPSLKSRMTIGLAYEINSSECWFEVIMITYYRTYAHVGRFRYNEVESVS